MHMIMPNRCVNGSITILKMGKVSELGWAQFYKERCWLTFFFVLLTVDYKTVRETFYELPELSLYYSNCSLHQKRRRTILDLNYTAQNATLTLFLSVRGAQ